jgi:hypothetical protein
VVGTGYVTTADSEENENKIRDYNVHIMHIPDAGVGCQWLASGL